MIARSNYKPTPHHVGIPDRRGYVAPSIAWIHTFKISDFSHLLLLIREPTTVIRNNYRTNDDKLFRCFVCLRALLHGRKNVTFWMYLNNPYWSICVALLVDDLHNYGGTILRYIPVLFLDLEFYTETMKQATGVIWFNTQMLTNLQLTQPENGSDKQESGRAPNSILSFAIWFNEKSQTL
ncbi:2387_t:CDS:2 [Acaulospora morrowiae]|uniref:2387_t:CDS:1 n=1 Tax=Acaulospora morrowiae TaxID=94023 RepID=A0A9N8VAH9_9GLOM|nr:2387_t:CDS:2 [Acaulospora morrowiae]